jgi:hypothetical protein
MPTLAKPTVHLFNFICSSDKLSGYGFGFGALIVHYRGQNQFAQVTAGQFIDYQPKYASVFFGLIGERAESGCVKWDVVRRISRRRWTDS